jgi:TPP-dependent 2-oxoacid decarboxylase
LICKEGKIKYIINPTRKNILIYVSTMLRCGQKSIILLINNVGYTIEVEIHDGPYNVIKNWNYTGLVDAIHNGQGKCWTTKVSMCFNAYKFGLVV